MLRRRPRARWLIAATALALLAAVGGGAALYLSLRTPPLGSLVTPTGVSVETVDTTPVVVPRVPRTRPAHHPRPETPCWKAFGGGPLRNFSRAEIDLGVPRRSVWARGLGDLMEYPPTYCDGRLFVNLERGKTVAIDNLTGAARGSGKAASPTARDRHRGQERDRQLTRRYSQRPSSARRVTRLAVARGRAGRILACGRRRHCVRRSLRRPALRARCIHRSSALGLRRAGPDQPPPACAMALICRPSASGASSAASAAPSRARSGYRHRHARLGPASRRERWLAPFGFTVSIFLLLFLGRVFQVSYLAYPLIGLVACGLAAAETGTRTG